MSMALPLCPPHRIKEAFKLMRQEVANMSPAVDAFAEEYLDYIRATYMNGNYGTATDGFEWNVYDDIEQGFLTNNPSEGAHNRLRTRAPINVALGLPLRLYESHQPLFPMPLKLSKS